MSFRFFHWQLTIGPAAPAPVRHYLVRAPRLEEPALTAAFAVANDSNRLWLAVNQQIDTLIENVQAQAWLVINEPQRALGYVAAAEHLMQLRDDLLARQEKAMPARRKVRSMKDEGEEK